MTTSVAVIGCDACGVVVGATGADEGIGVAGVWGAALLDTIPG